MVMTIRLSTPQLDYESVLLPANGFQDSAICCIGEIRLQKHHMTEVLSNHSIQLKKKRHKRKKELERDTEKDKLHKMM